MATTKPQEPETATVPSSDTGNIIWGILIISGGLLLLANNFGYIDREFWRAIFFFWPLLLILFGIQIIIGYHLISRIALFFISLALVVFVILFGLQVTDSPLLPTLPPVISQLLSNLEDYYESTQNVPWSDFNRPWR